MAEQLQSAMPADLECSADNQLAWRRACFGIISNRRQVVSHENTIVLGDGIEAVTNGQTIVRPVQSTVWRGEQGRIVMRIDPTSFDIVALDVVPTLGAQIVSQDRIVEILGERWVAGSLGFVNS